MSALWNFIITGLWFWIIAGAITCLVMWIPIMINPKKRVKFSDEDLSKGLSKRHPDYIDSLIHRVFANRLGVVMLTFIAWPAFVYLMIFYPHGTGRNGRHWNSHRSLP